ncbi:hypothetical protein [Sporomusa sp.]|uniref:hypothetical protein n=1 Tax=Sporomusa sp. TaxID=2078658 RepID=UPI002B7D8BC7|nr:hypothetical protein [Sporomusa sp.]HWR45128.1 hypothetical protein [Sporomusa sp.]
MERKSAKRKQLSLHLRRKYKRYAAALAGAAIMTGAVLPGIPVAKAFAAESPSVPPSPAINYMTQLDKNTQKPVKKVVAEKNRNDDRNGPPGRGWHEHLNSWPGADENQAWYQDGRIYYRSDYDRTDYAYNLSNPIDVVKDTAALYGFNRYMDSFTLLSRTSNKAVVEVIKHDTGKLFNVFLERTGDHDWTIVRTQAL